MAYTFNTELKSVAFTYARLMNVKISRSTLANALEENPAFPSLLSLSDVFYKFRVENAAIRIPKSNFMELAGQTPFVAYFKTSEIGLDFVVVDSITESKVGFYHKGRKPVYLPYEEFATRYRDVVWKIFDAEKGGDVSFKEKRTNERNSLLLKTLCVLTLVGSLAAWVDIDKLSSLFSESWFPLFVKAFGLSVSVLLLAFEVDRNNSFVKNICALNGKTNCDAVLSSEGSNILGISWAEVGSVYFASTALILCNSNIAPSARLSFASLFSALAALYIPFSLFFQWRVVKQWCVLCLAIQGALFCELIYWLFASDYVFFALPVDPVEYITATACFLLPAAMLILFKPLSEKVHEHRLFRSAYRRLQYNPEVFDALLHNQDTVPSGWENIGIDVGNPSATNTIIKICNPYCGPCSKSHSVLEKVIERNQNVKMKIIYISQNTATSMGARVVKYFILIRNALGTSAMNHALHYWYSTEEKSFEGLSEKFPVKADLATADAEIDSMSTWCILANVTHTPTIFINGYRLPENYKVEEIEHIL